MSKPIATYSFLPWVRQGLGQYIQEDDQAAGVALRASVQIQVKAKGTPVEGTTNVEATVSKPVALYGPGDIIGLDSKAIIRVEPQPQVTNFENNYMPFVEFYDEDLPWRYTPARPNGQQLRPWMVLLVLADGEFEEGKNMLNRPLPFVTIANPASKFPHADSLWAWAHVHVYDNIGANETEVFSSDTAALSNRLSSLLAANRDKACSRLLSPRILAPNTSYTAFLMPAFEAGRLAGLGLDPAATPFATFEAWESYPSGTKAEPENFPYYHRWNFRTGSLGDFEYLVRLLQPKPVDPRVGNRDMDVRNPGSGVPAIDKPELNGILRLGGALKVPFDTLSDEDKAEVLKYENWDQGGPTPFQEGLAQFINLPDDYAATAPATANAGTGLNDWQKNDPNPLITAPLYGRWHAAVRRLLEDRDGNDLPNQGNWIHELNLDPRYRVPAGFGTEVVKKNQEDYMLTAWEQVGDVLKGNQRIERGLMAAWVSKSWHTQHLAPMKEAAPQQFLMLTAPVHRRVMQEGLTLHYQAKESTLPLATMSKPFRQALRPRGRMAKMLFPAGGLPLGNLFDRINRGEVSAAPPRELSPTLPAKETIGGQLQTETLPAPVVDALKAYPWLRWLLFLLALVLGLVLFFFSKVIGSGVGLALLALAFWLYRKMDQALEEEEVKDLLDPTKAGPDIVDKMPPVPNLVLTRLGDNSPVTTGGSDGVVAQKFKAALRNQYQFQETVAQLPVKVRQPLPLPLAASNTLSQIEPLKTIPARIQMQILLPEVFRAQLVEQFDRIMVYPRIDLPMYLPLKDISAELFLPNIQLIGQNSITLLETNQKFIEAYMVGLNHEMSRELLWREYPTDQRGSYFRQFWDVSDFLPPNPAASQTALRESLYDIPELHKWSLSSELGDHDHRETGGDKEEELVLTIRGELLKKYPNAVIYAHRAVWDRNTDNSINRSKPRQLAPIPEANESNPPKNLVKTPIYEASVAPDIYFFGFDITAKEAKGGEIDARSGEEDPGWFFVIKERPGDPRFGLDIPLEQPRQPLQRLNTWNELSWTDVVNTLTPGTSLVPGEKTITLTSPGTPATPQEEAVKAQHDQDVQFRWRPDTHAAELAYILYQVPVLMAVHASEMLPKD